MKLLKKLLVATAGAVFIALPAGETAQAITLFTETIDAGETLDTAQAVDTEPAGTLLTTISGSISQDDADLFKLFLIGNQSFSATTENRATFETQLFLFDADGFGVEANDDTNDYCH